MALKFRHHFMNMVRGGPELTIKTTALLTSMLLLAPPAISAPEDSLEAGIKATYLYKMAPFVEWPGSAFKGETTPFVICVIGRDPFGPLLDRAVAGQRVGSHPIIVNRLAVAVHDSRCHIAYLGGSPTQGVKEALQLLDKAPVLTVTSGPATPGAVDFVVTDGRVRFRIDNQAAADGGLSISSKLLSLALSVKPKTMPGFPP